MEGDQKIMTLLFCCRNQGRQQFKERRGVVSNGSKEVFWAKDQDESVGSGS